MSFKFKPEDFACECPGPEKNPGCNKATTPGHYDWCEAIESADTAQALLEAHLKTLPRVSCHKSSYEIGPWLEHWDAKEDGFSTHTALLWGVEEIK